jgi:broad specificity phosphatase PhoE
LMSTCSSFVIPLLLPISTLHVRTTTTTAPNTRHARIFILQERTQQPSMLEYTSEGKWDSNWIAEQIALVPPVQIVSTMPPPLVVPTSHENNSDTAQTHTNTPSIHYYLLRHGQSTANVAEIISSDRYTLSYTDKHGLTELGIQQASNAGSALLQCIQERIAKRRISMSSTTSSSDPIGHRILFVSSPFARARQTALACLHSVQALVQASTAVQPQSQLLPSFDIIPTILLNPLLVERYFGNYDNDTLTTYGYVWPLDRINITQTAHNVESVAAVATRIHTLLHQLQEYVTNHLENNQNDVLNRGKDNDDDDDDETNTCTDTDHPYSQYHIVLVSHGDVVQIAQLYAANSTNVGEFSSYRFQSTCFLVVFTCFGWFCVLILVLLGRLFVSFA